MFSKQARGFTLIEMMVVIVLISLISGLLVQGLSYMQQIDRRAARHIENERIEELQWYWFHGLMSGLTPAREGISNEFRATSEQMEGLTLVALQSPAGVPTPFQLKLESQKGLTRLLYKIHQDQYWVLGEWPGENIRFAYQDDQGIWQDQWPPKDDKTGKTMGLPVAVMLNVADTEALPWAVSVVGRRKPHKDWSENLGL